jgi:hypothetical protein
MKRNHPTRQLRENPNIDQLKRQAKDLLKAFLAGDPDAVAEVNAHYRRRTPRFALHDAQLVLARSYGFDSWPKLKAYVEGATIQRLAELVRAGDLDRVRSMLKARPELANMEMSYGDEATFRRDESIAGDGAAAAAARRRPAPGYPPASRCHHGDNHGGRTRVR